MTKRDDTVLFTRPEGEPESLVKTHDLRRMEVPHDPALSFELLVPLEMATAMPKMFLPETHDRPMPLAVFGLRPALEGPRVYVCAQTLAWEVDPLEWLRWLWAQAGWKIAVAKTHPGPGGPRYELGELRELDGEVEVRRVMAARSGARLVRCEVSASLDAWPQWHDALWHVLEGFGLGRPERRSIETMVAFEGPLLGFGLPGSWEARASGSEDGGMSWAAQPVRDAQRGAALTVHACRLGQAPSAEERRAALWRGLREAEGRLGAVLETEREVFSECVPGWVGQWQAAVRTSRGDGVVVLVQRENDGVAIDYVMVAPAAGVEHLDWMRATRALDVAVATSLPKSPRVAA